MFACVSSGERVRAFAAAALTAHSFSSLLYVHTKYKFSQSFLTKRKTHLRVYIRKTTVTTMIQEQQPSFGGTSTLYVLQEFFSNYPLVSCQSRKNVAS